MKRLLPIMVSFLVLAGCHKRYKSTKDNQPPKPPEPKQQVLPKISVSGKNFVDEDGKTFRAWGLDASGIDGGLLEDNWEDDDHMVKIEKAFMDVKGLEANVIRLHLQIGKFLTGKNTVNQFSFQRLEEIFKLAEKYKLYIEQRYDLS